MGNMKNLLQDIAERMEQEKLPAEIHMLAYDNKADLIKGKPYARYTLDTAALMGQMILEDGWDVSEITLPDIEAWIHDVQDEANAEHANAEHGEQA